MRIRSRKELLDLIRTLKKKGDLKYGNKKTRCSLGHRHPSHVECAYCEGLQMLKRNGDIYDFQYERRFELRVKDILIGHHKPDFCVFPTKEHFEQDFPEIHEVKGAVTTDFNMRRKLFEVLYPYEYILIR